MRTFTVNGHPVSVDVPDEMPLLWVLRDELGLTGTKYGCGESVCGICTVQLDGRPALACATAVAAADGKNVTTIEGIATDPNGDPVPAARAVQDAWRRLDVVQCGYCQSGQIVAAVSLLQTNPRPSDADIDAAMSGTICRCATFVRIRAAIHEAAKVLAA
ncbi:MAG TPA: (2Fe-2S)-binding protein [Steroidobacteraceae bacterium]|jgi:isoquinoline 1-oxidoreductase alpha subunit|nr:(2Fe-2S)-binding protein [Steroidobacteraceae bacterium]